MIRVPTDRSTRQFAVDCFMEDREHGRASSIEAADILEQLREFGDVALLERLSTWMHAR